MAVQSIPVLEVHLEAKMVRKVLSAVAIDLCSWDFLSVKRQRSAVDLW